ncbi:MAG TPA: outer membrane beta-barrel protein [Flavobacteriales bacterium]
MRLSLRSLSIGLTTVFVIGLSGHASAQVFKEGSNSIGLGYGFGTFLGGLSSNFDQFGEVKYKGTGPLYFKFEHGVSDRIGLGVNVAYATNQWDYTYTSDSSTYKETTKRSTYSVLARFNYHFGNSDRFDPYLGLGLGYRNAKWTVEDSGSGTSGVELKSLMPFGMELTIGARYFFSPNIAGYLEVGGAKSVAQVGVSAMF